MIEFLMKACKGATGGCQAMEVVRKIASAGPRQLALLREAHCLESCIHLVKHAPLDSQAANMAVTLLRQFAEWDMPSR